MPLDPKYYCKIKCIIFNIGYVQSAYKLDRCIYSVYMKIPSDDGVFFYDNSKTLLKWSLKIDEPKV